MKKYLIKKGNMNIILVLIISLVLISGCTTGKATKAVVFGNACEDSDGGINFEKLGVTTIDYSDKKGGQTKSDFCKDQNTLYEFYCDDGNLYLTKKTCICEKGTCV